MCRAWRENPRALEKATILDSEHALLDEHDYVRKILENYLIEAEKRLKPNLRRTETD